MTDETTRILVESIIQKLPELVFATLKNYQERPDSINEEIHVQWQLILLLVEQGMASMEPTLHERLADEVEHALLKVSEAMDEIDAEQEHTTSLQDSTPIESYWTDDELQQFTQKGA